MMKILINNELALVNISTNGEEQKYSEAEKYMTF